jgi:hypothetical protein
MANNLVLVRLGICLSRSDVRVFMFIYSLNIWYSWRSYIGRNKKIKKNAITTTLNDGRNVSMGYHVVITEAYHMVTTEIMASMSAHILCKYRSDLLASVF